MRTLTVTTGRESDNRSAPAARPNGDRTRWSDPVSVELARKWGMASPRTAEELIRKLIPYTEDLIRALPDGERRARACARLKRAMDDTPAHMLSRVLISEYKKADAADDVTLTEFLQTNSDRDLSMEIRALDTTIAKACALREALAAKEQERLRLAQ